MASIKEILNKALNYKHLVNPLKTAFSKGTSVLDAPGGSWKLSDDPKTNMALWNAIYSAPAVFGLSYLVNNIANRKAETEVDEKLDTQLIDKLQALRPRLVSDPNLEDTESFTELPQKELKRLETIKAELNKAAADDDEDPSWDKDLKQWVIDTLKSSIKGAIPIGAAALAASGGIALSNANNKDRIKKDLEARRVQLRNIQALIDRQMLVDKGLVKGASSKKDKDSGDKEGSKIGLLEGAINAPLLAHILIAGGLGLGTYKFMRAKDPNEKKLSYLKKVQLGSNVLQDTPQLSVLDLPIDPAKVLAVPGDKKQETLIAEETKPVEVAAADIIDVKPIEDSGIFQEIKKKDALFA